MRVSECLRCVVQWVPIVINLLVHVIMYAYYAFHALGIDVWWKRYLTMFQIVQASLMLVVVVHSFMFLCVGFQFVVALIGCFGGLGPRTLHDLGLKWLPRVSSLSFPFCVLRC